MPSSIVEHNTQGVLVEFLHGKVARWPAAARIDLYRRAAGADDDPLAVVRHLLDAAEPQAAAAALAHTGGPQLRVGRAETLRDLIDRIPTEVLATPELCALAGDLAVERGELVRARRSYERRSGAVQSSPGSPTAWCCSGGWRMPTN